MHKKELLLKIAKSLRISEHEILKYTIQKQSKGALILDIAEFEKKTGF